MAIPTAAQHNSMESVNTLANKDFPHTIGVSMSLFNTFADQ